MLDTWPVERQRLWFHGSENSRHTYTMFVFRQQTGLRQITGTTTYQNGIPKTKSKKEIDIMNTQITTDRTKIQVINLGSPEGLRLLRQHLRQVANQTVDIARKYLEESEQGALPHGEGIAMLLAMWSHFVTQTALCTLDQENGTANRHKQAQQMKMKSKLVKEFMRIAVPTLRRGLKRAGYQPEELSPRLDPLLRECLCDSIT